jgi:hypothetical protein
MMSWTYEQMKLFRELPSRVQPYFYAENWAAINVSQDEYNNLKSVSQADIDSGITSQTRLSFMTEQLAWLVREKSIERGPLYTKLSLLVNGQQVDTFDTNG